MFDVKDIFDVYDFILLYIAPFLIGMSMRCGTRKWDRPLLVTFCVVFIVIVGTLITPPKVSLDFYVIFFGCMIFGALAADIIYRIRRQRKERKDGGCNKRNRQR